MAGDRSEFSTKLSLHKFMCVCDSLTDDQKQLVNDIGSGYLRVLCC